MPTPHHQTGEPWESTSDFAWTDRAFDLLEQSLLNADVTVDDGVLRTRVWGSCPRCAGQLDDRQVPTAVGDFGPVRGPNEATGLAPAVVVVDVTCGCGHTHVGAPEGTTGCGVSFRVELEAESAPANPLGTP